MIRSIAKGFPFNGPNGKRYTVFRPFDVDITASGGETDGVYVKLANQMKAPVELRGLVVTGVSEDGALVAFLCEAVERFPFWAHRFIDVQGRVVT